MVNKKLKKETLDNKKDIPHRLHNTNKDNLESNYKVPVRELKKQFKEKNDR